MDPAEEETLLVALDLVVEEDPTPRREGDEGGGDKGGGDKGGAFARRRWEDEHWVRMYMTRTGRFRDANILLRRSGYCHSSSC